MPPNSFQKKSACGNAPDFGAIFMSNRCTMVECFERKLFGLPHAFAEFVKKVKAGVILFLFEYEQKKLYGVFRAASDGGMDIVPHAYRSTGKRFPAQVCFSEVWKCHPLSEPDFHDAIRENYFAERKFNIGLSRYQVERLLYLFHSTIVRVQKPLSKKQVKRRHSTTMAKLYTSLDSAEDVMVESQATKIVDVPHTLNERTSHFQHPFTTGTSNLFTSLDEYITTSSDGKASSRFSGCQTVPLERKSECIDVSSNATSSGLGDYIPLSFSPEQFEPTETGQAFSEATCDAHQSDIYPRVKGLYSDIPTKKGNVFSRLNLEPKPLLEKNEVPTKKGNVFSRLNLEPKPSLEKNEDNSDMGESIHEIMKKLQKCHKKWEKANRKTISVVHGIGDRTLKKRSSVFSRLTIASEAQRKDFKNLNTCRHETGAKVHADGAVAGGGSENGQKKRKLVSPILRDELDINMEIRDRWCLEVQMQPHESSAGKEKVGSCEGSTRSDKSGDNEIEFHPEDMVLSVICPSTSEGKGEEQERGLTNVGSMLENELGSAGKERVGNCEGLTRSDKSGDNEIEFRPEDMVLSVICPSTSDGKGEEQERGLTNVGSMLENELGSTANHFNEVSLKPLKTYQRRRRVCDTKTAPTVLKSLNVGDVTFEGH